MKLFLPPAIALFGLLLFVGFTAVQLDDNDSRLVSLEKQRYPTLEAADNVIFQFSRLPGLLNSAVAAGERDTLDEASDVLADVHARLRDLEPLTAERADRNRELQAWSAANKRYADNALASFGQLLDGAAFDDLRSHFDRMASDLKNAQALGEQFRSHAYVDFQSSLTQVRADNATTTHVGYLLSFCLLLLVSASAAWVIRQVMGNVRGVIASLRTIASGDGDLTRRVHVDSSDEIGEMIGLFNGLLDSLQDALRQVIETAAPLEQMSHELHRLTQGAEDSARSQQERSESISRDIDTMTNSIQEVAQRSRQASEQASAAPSQAEVANIFLGKNSSLKGLDQKGWNLTKERFYSALTNKNESQLKSYWPGLVFTGKGQPLQSVDDDAAVIAKVGSESNAIGYVDTSAVNDKVKVLFTLP